MAYFDTFVLSDPNHPNAQNEPNALNEPNKPNQLKKMLDFLSHVQ